MPRPIKGINAQMTLSKKMNILLQNDVPKNLASHYAPEALFMNPELFYLKTRNPDQP